MITTDAIGDKYDLRIDRESAEEILAAKGAQAAAAADEAKAQAIAEKEAAAAAKEAARAQTVAAKEAARQQAIAAREAAKPSMADKMLQSAARSAATSIGRQVAGSFGKSLVRGILGGLFK